MVLVMLDESLTNAISGVCNCHILSWSYDGVCSNSERNNSVGRKVCQRVISV